MYFWAQATEGTKIYKLLINCEKIKLLFFFPECCDLVRNSCAMETKLHL